LLADEHEVVAPARREQACERLRALGSVSMTLDFNDSLALQESMKGCDAVVHIAAHLKMWGPWADFVASNVTLTEQVVRAAEALGVRRFVHVSAASVVMHAPGPIRHADESSTLTKERCLPYSATKAMAECRWCCQPTQTHSRPWPCDRHSYGVQATRSMVIWVNRYAKANSPGSLRVGTRMPPAMCKTFAMRISLALWSEVTGAFFVTDDEEVTLRDFMSQRLRVSGIKSPSLSVPASVAWLFGGALEKLWATGWLPGAIRR
jgi:hypothetical protein